MTPSLPSSPPLVLMLTSRSVEVSAVFAGVHRGGDQGGLLILGISLL
jgi:hypothetical protein